MTDNRTTERFRELLTERGIEWRAGLAGSTIVGKWCFFEIGGKLAATTGYEPALTPEQAIAATLGSDDRHDAIYNAGFGNGVKATLQQLEGIMNDKWSSSLTKVENIEEWIAEQWKEYES